MSDGPWRRTFTAADIAAILGVHPKTVLAWHRRRALAGYTREDLRDFLRTYTDWTGRLPR
jgi:hypothetical protein